MKVLQVKASSHTYNIHIGNNLRYDVNKFLTKDYSSILIITDEKVADLYLADVKKSLEENKVYEAIIKSGEASKSIETYYYLQSEAIKSGLDRHSLIIALGGGVVGDIAGFVAATYMRGIDYVQMPTTILAHDSSVGGKVAINHELGKNMIGNFYAPQTVIYDVSTLETLPEHEIRSGYAELIKEAFIANHSLLDQLLQVDLKQLTALELKEFLYEGIKIKAHIVERDEKESSIRKFLNLGHTLAHALETELGYGKITHGEAVAIGILFAIRVSEQQFNVQLPYTTLLTWLQKNNYPIGFHVNITSIIQRMKSDKKSKNNLVQMVLMHEVTKLVIEEMNDEKLYTYLQVFKKELETL